MVIIIQWRLTYFSNAKATIIVFLCKIVLWSDLFRGIFQTNILIEMDIGFTKWTLLDKRQAKHSRTSYLVGMAFSTEAFMMLQNALRGHSSYHV